MSFLHKCGTCCMLLSIWAVIQLIFMGIFYKIKATPLVEDVFPHEYTDYKDFIDKTNKNFDVVAMNCWIAAGMYAGMIMLSCMCIMAANKSEKRNALNLEDDEIACTPKEPKRKQLKLKAPKSPKRRK